MITFLWLFFTCWIKIEFIQIYTNLFIINYHFLIYDISYTNTLFPFQICALSFCNLETMDSWKLITKVDKLNFFTSSVVIVVRWSAVRNLLKIYYKMLSNIQSLKKVLQCLVVLFATLLILTFFCFGFYSGLNFGNGWSDISLRITILMILFTFWMLVLLLLYYLLRKISKRFEPSAASNVAMVSA